MATGRKGENVHLLSLRGQSEEDDECVLSEERGDHSSGGNRMQSVRNQVDQVIDIMRTNMGKVLERDVQLSDLQDRSDSLNVASEEFLVTARRTSRGMWWKNVKDQKIESIDRSMNRILNLIIRNRHRSIIDFGRSKRFSTEIDGRSGTRSIRDDYDFLTKVSTSIARHDHQKSIESTSMDRESRDRADIEGDHLQESIDHRGDKSIGQHRSPTKSSPHRDDPSQPIDRRDIDHTLDQVERGVEIDDYAVLIRLPFLCSSSRNRDLERRFLRLLDRWFEAYENSPTKRKPTSIVYHLGRLNREYDGRVVEKLTAGKLKYLIKAASKPDFRKLHGRTDLTSFMAGVRMLVQDRSRRIINPSLIIGRRQFFENLQTYLDDMAIKRKTAHDDRDRSDRLSATINVQGSIDRRQHRGGRSIFDGRNHYQLEDDWIFMITRESTSILTFLRDFYPNLDDLRERYEDIDRLLITLCQLCRRGFEYYRDSSAAEEEDRGDSKLSNVDGQLIFTLNAFADVWLSWRYDPEQRLGVRGVWDDWFDVYESLFATNRVEICDGSMDGIRHHLSYAAYLARVASKFGKIDRFVAISDRWSDEIERSLDDVTRRLASIRHGDPSTIDSSDDRRSKLDEYKSTIDRSRSPVRKSIESTKVSVEVLSELLGREKRQKFEKEERR